MKINNSVEFKLSKDLVEYDSAIEFMNSHINKMKKNNAKELLWFLEHDHIYTQGTSATTSEIIKKILEIIPSSEIVSVKKLNQDN